MNPINEIDDDHDAPQPEAPFSFWTVAIYLVDRSYGGPEEGGWWYDAGERQDYEIDSINPTFMLSVFYAEQRAYNFADALQSLLNEGPNKGRRPISSMASTGRYQALVYNGHPPKHFPEVAPHYE